MTAEPYFHRATIARLAEQILIACRQACDEKGRRTMQRVDSNNIEVIAAETIADALEMGKVQLLPESMPEPARERPGIDDWLACEAGIRELWKDSPERVAVEITRLRLMATLSPGMALRYQERGIPVVEAPA